MKPVLSHYVEIVREVKRLEEKGPLFIDDDDAPALRRFIGLSDGRQVFVSAKIDKGDCRNRAHHTFERSGSQVRLFPS